MTYNILLVEGNRDDRFLTKLALKETKINATIIETRNGETALNLIHKLKNENSLPDLIIMDINLPAINGLELLNQIKSNRINIPVVILTSSDSEDDKRFGIENGAKLFFKKPNNISDLKKIILETIKQIPLKA